MANEMRILKVCPGCNGTGEQTSPPPGGSGECPQCHGEGKFVWEVEASDLFDKLDDILNKCNDILEAVQGS